MGRITVLDPATVNQIAAGEVVERPAAVVKELLENALDAGARKIHVEVAGGGLDRIAVTDDGCGMDPDDAVLAFERHATSKIRQAGDLAAVNTLGFRGEALPSIAAVARVTLRTRTRDAPGGVELRLEGGRLLGTSPVGVPAGTTVVVEDLFFNTPARHKFLRSPSFEGGLCTEAVGRLALARPEVAFTLRANDRQVFATPGRGNLKETIAAVLGPATAREMVPVTWDGEGITLDGFAGRPALTRSSRRQQTLIINGRYVKSFIVAGAIDGAYRDFVPAGRHPVVVLHLNIDPAAVDVNVHPAKLEVKVADQAALVRLVLAALRAALGGAAPGRTAADVEAEEPPGRPGPPAAGGWAGGGLPPAGGRFRQAAPELGAAAEALAFYAPAAPSLLRYLGWFFPTYILAQGPDGLYIIDQHAAHERVLYEEFMDRLSARGGASQMLAAPVSLELGPRETAVAEEYGGILEKLGFIVDSFGGGTAVLRGVPAAGWRGEDAGGAAELFRDVLERLGESGVSDPVAAHGLLAASLACHRAVRGGSALDPAEAQRLLDRLEAAREPAVCPHGRPTYFKITAAELARRFQRA
ncbi:MAG: DNA mismatch repair endonuclease MutL [Thermoanaerobacterales bacterium]|nr:DNA mismatch repair endonuclease MutL [Thermoanaerobacterales bacterium]